MPHSSHLGTTQSTIKTHVVLPYRDVARIKQIDKHLNWCYHQCNWYKRNLVKSLTSSIIMNAFIILGCNDNSFNIIQAVFDYLFDLIPIWTIINIRESELVLIEQRNNHIFDLFKYIEKNCSLIRLNKVVDKIAWSKVYHQVWNGHTNKLHMVLKISNIRQGQNQAQAIIKSTLEPVLLTDFRLGNRTSFVTW